MCFCFVGCNSNPALFFGFNFTNLTLEVGDSVDIFDLGVNSNLAEYAQMHIYSSNDSIISINNSVITAKKEGEVTITASGNVNGEYLSASFLVKVVDNNNLNNVENPNDSQNTEAQNTENEQVGDLAIKNFEQIVKSNKIVITFAVTLNEQDYTNFSYNIVSGQENVLGEVAKFSNTIELQICVDGSVTIAILNGENSNKILLTLPTYNP